MNANEMYQASRASRGKSKGLSNRVFSALCRAGYASTFEGVDVEKLKSDTLNGKIWEARNIGKKTVLLLCEWLAAQESAEIQEMANERELRLYRVAYQFNCEYDSEDPEDTFYVAAESFAHTEAVAGKFLDDLSRDLLPWFIHRIEYISATLALLPDAQQATLVVPSGVEVEDDDGEADPAE